MKKIIFTILVFSACSSDHNKVMTNLINQKKMIEDSLSTAQYYEKKYGETYMIVAKDSTDQYLDSIKKYMIIRLRVKDELSAINFSIDSLSKMK